MTVTASNLLVMKRALWLLLLLPGLCVFAFGGDRGTCDTSWHCVAPASAFADDPGVADEGPALAETEKVAPAVPHHVATALLDAVVPPGE